MQLAPSISATNLTGKLINPPRGRKNKKKQEKEKKKRKNRFKKQNSALISETVFGFPRRSTHHLPHGRKSH